MYRFFDILISFFGLIFMSPFFLIIFFFGLIDTGSPFFIQERVGKNKKPFRLIKFRTMKISTKNVASHLVSSNNITSLGTILRKFKLDELPQLINVFNGDMSFVGPRPNLFNQSELIKFRDKIGAYDVSPGITGLAQINKIDMSNPRLLARIDNLMIKNMNLASYFYYIIKTISGSGRGDAAKLTK